MPSQKHHLAYSFIQLKSMISGGGQGSSCLQAAMRLHYIATHVFIHEHNSYKLNFDVQHFEHN